MDNESLTFRQNSLRKSLGDEWEDVIQDAKMRCLRYTYNPEYDRILKKVIHNTAVDFLKRRERRENILTEEQERVAIESQGMRELTYKPDFGAIADVQSALRKHWNKEESDAIYLYLTRQVSLPAIQKILKKSKTECFRIMFNALEVLKYELREYA